LDRNLTAGDLDEGREQGLPPLRREQESTTLQFTHTQNTAKYLKKMFVTALASLLETSELALMVMI
jgi:hypothetical protein